MRAIATRPVDEHRHDGEVVPFARYRRGPYIGLTRVEEPDKWELAQQSAP
jgi:hypothetical protein